ncbi:ATP-binding cassette domain-containing protein [Gryllotalpicola reticulitermitis]|uniref:ATP-binding cassette domain-containing protein n=1 Tax=Gryllotalpicola reticulitermitis TaxID=1184153 RepID=A0ABV8Q671_9MICO
MHVTPLQPAARATTERTGSRAQDLVARGICYRYPQAADEVIHDFSHRFLPGTLTALVAPSGAGKSTLLSLLSLLLAPRTGTISLGDVVVERHRTSTVRTLRRTHFNQILQNNACFESRTAVDNVATALLSSGVTMSSARRAAGAALASVGLSSRAEMPARLLSGGEQQRMTIARALLTDRPYLLADCPTR